VEIAKTFGVRLVDLDLIVSLFRNKSATFHISKPAFELILQGRLLHRRSNEIQSLKPPLPNSDEYYGWVSQNENINKSPLVNSVVSWIHRLLPSPENPSTPFFESSSLSFSTPFSCSYSSYTFSPNYLHYTPSKSAKFSDFDNYRADKETILCALSFWRLHWAAATSCLLGNDFEASNELLRWILHIHIDAICREKPKAALHCLSSFSNVISRFPVMVRKEFLLGCQTAASLLSSEIGISFYF
jgi:hypothetical protein